MAAEDARELLSYVGALARAEHRPWSEFFHEFRKPKSFSDRSVLEKRVYTNFLYYRENYLEVFAAMFCVTILWRRSLLLILAAVLAAVFYLFRYRRVPIVLGSSRVVTRREKAAGVVGLALFLTWLFGNVFAVFVLCLVSGKCFFANLLRGDVGSLRKSRSSRRHPPSMFDSSDCCFVNYPRIALVRARAISSPHII